MLPFALRCSQHFHLPSMLAFVEKHRVCQIPPTFGGLLIAKYGQSSVYFRRPSGKYLPQPYFRRQSFQSTSALSLATIFDSPGPKRDTRRRFSLVRAGFKAGARNPRLTALYLRINGTAALINCCVWDGADLTK